MNKTKTAMITVCGRPNVGKSSLTNALVGEKIAIVSNKPQTTRNRIYGVVNRGDTQPLTGVSVWGMFDFPNDQPTSYTYKMNGTHSGLLNEKGIPKDVFWQIEELLKE